VADRDLILDALRAAAGPPTPPPEVTIDALRYADPIGRFAEAVEEAGGRCIAVPEGAGPEAALRELPVFAGAERLLSGVPGLLPEDAGRHDPADLDLAILPGAPAVAESGAVWVVPPDVQQRAAAFLAQHVVLVVPRAAVVHELHEAYARIDPSAAPFGCFIAGPSKTADIEQALVIGAHGPRSLTVLLHGPRGPATR
jgi:L-lactate dehydrogenase complex protein LldG